MAREVVRAVTCPVCGTLCDDIEVIVEDGRIIDVRNACAMGAAKFLHAQEHRMTQPMVRKNGELKPVGLEEAIKEAARILAEADYPILYGWSSTSCEAIRVGLELAEEVGGVIDNTATTCHGPSILAIQEVGLSGFTLGQIRHRADLVIYWGSNPWDAHPRHLERYSAFSEGRFQPSSWRRAVLKLKAMQARRRALRARGPVFLAKEKMPEIPPVPDGPEIPPEMALERRKLVVVDVRRTPTAERADYFLRVRPGEDFELLQALRMVVRGEELDVPEVAGVPSDIIYEVADIMMSCRCGVLFFGLGLTMSKGKIRNVEAAISLVRDLNRYTKFHILPMRGHFNVTGANIVFTWTTGYPFAVDFSHGYPRYNPGETSVIDILLRGDSDAALIVASDPVAHFPRKAVEHLVSNPLIVLDPAPTPTTAMADVVIPTAWVGIEVEGTAYRMDHVPIPLRKVVDPPPGVLSDAEVLRHILAEVRKLKAS
ncbi:formylmethanofuran dehydrogenase subunit B [Candidatus Bathyarchaeota archaeon ex4484_135]|nr:MAG: formylmethanofuran dehydrogenase subunit B [Candidatus Bathyarchaeota archaeon ex4484_135]